jgi:hypothetical protein
MKNSSSSHILVVLIEDTGALIGLIILTLGLALSVFVHPIFDGIAALMIGTLLIGLSSILFIELKKLLIGESVDWSKIFSLMLSDKFNSVSDFLMSKDFFDILKEISFNISKKSLLIKKSETELNLSLNIKENILLQSTLSPISNFLSSINKILESPISSVPIINAAIPSKIG